MGTCVSKCYPCTPSEQIREKIGFTSAFPKIVPNTSSSSSSYASPKIVPRSVPNTHHLSPPSSSYTYTCTSSSTSSSSSMASSSSSCSSSATNSTCKPFSNEFLLSCARNNPNLNLEFPPSCADDGNYSIVVLDPKKRTWEATTTKFPVPPPPPPPQRRTVAIRGPPSQNPSFPAKRVRSSSPTPRTGRKSFRADPPPPPSTAPGGRGRARKEKTIEQQAHQSRSLSANSEKERFSNRIHRIAPPPPPPPRGSEVRGVEALLPKKESFRASPLLEDLNNPLISMDCFIFL